MSRTASSRSKEKSTVTRRDAITSHPGCAATSRGDRHGEILGFRPGTAVMIDYRVAGAPPISTKCTASLRQGEFVEKTSCLLSLLLLRSSTQFNKSVRSGPLNNLYNITAVVVCSLLVVIIDSIFKFYHITFYYIVIKCNYYMVLKCKQNCN